MNNTRVAPALALCYHQTTMQRLKRLIYLTIFNILVSATTVLSLLYVWDSGKERFSPGQAEVASQPGVTIVVVNSAHEGTAVMQTLEASPVPTEFIDPASPTPPNMLYQVQAGDTLGILADRFDISLYDILAINNLEDPNNLFVGQTILIPTGPLPTLTRTFTPTPTLPPSSTPTPLWMQPPTATPTLTLQAPVILIQSILGVGDLQTEQVKITLTGSTELSLTGWQLVDSNEHSFIFPKFELFPNGSIQVNSRAGINTATDLYWGLAIAIWQSGETAQLLDETGKLQATFQVP